MGTVLSCIVLAIFGTMVFFGLINEVKKDYAAVKIKDYSRLIGTGISMLFALSLLFAIDYLASKDRRPGEIVLKCTAYKPDTATAADCVRP